MASAVRRHSARCFSVLAIAVPLVLGLSACSGSGARDAASSASAAPPGSTSAVVETTSSYVATTEAFEARGTWPLLPGVPGGRGTPATASLTSIDGGDQVVVHLTVGPVLPLSSVVGQGFSCPAIADLSRTAAVGVAYALYVASSRPASVRLDLDPGRLGGDLALPVASNLRDGSCEIGQPTARTAELSHDAKTQGAAWVLIPDAVDSDGTINQSVAGYALRPKLGVGASVDHPVGASQTNGYARPVVDGCPSATVCIPFSAS